MLSFKDQLALDTQNVFINPGEFGEMHLIDGREMMIILDEDLLQQRKSSASNPTDGIYNATLLFYALKSDFDKKPVIDSQMKLDARMYKVADIQEDEAMYTITLRRNGS